MVRSTLLQLLSEAGPLGKNRGFQVLHDSASLHAAVEDQKHSELEEAEFVMRAQIVEINIQIRIGKKQCQEAPDKSFLSFENVTPVLYFSAHQMKIIKPVSYSSRACRNDQKRSSDALIKRENHDYSKLKIFASASKN